jgi:hypothetical protein
VRDLRELSGAGRWRAPDTASTSTLLASSAGRGTRSHPRQDQQATPKGQGSLAS